MNKTADTKCWFGKTGCGARCTNEGTHGDRRSFMSDFVKAARFCDKHRSAEMKQLAGTVTA